MSNNQTNSEYALMDINQLYTLIPSLHLKQIERFLYKRGIEFYFLDSDDRLTKFLKKQWRYNKIPLHLEPLWRMGAVTGEILFFVRPVKNNYKIFYYPADQFEPHYDNDAELDYVYLKDIINEGDSKIERSWKITADTFELWDGERTGEPKEIMSNPYGFLPCLILQNKENQGGRGYSEFYYEQQQIEEHNWLIKQINGNVEFFGGPIYYSSRSKSEMIEAEIIGDDRNSIAAAQGYRAPVARTSTRVKARRVISGLEEGEQLGFTTPTPIDPSVFQFIDKFGDDLRAALGGVADSAFVSAGGGLFDFQYRYSQAFITASRKADIYIEYGLIEAFKLLLKMADFDDRIVYDQDEDDLRWRYLGEVFPATYNNVLTKSIVSRNLLRLGVNLKESLRYVFPEKTDEELEDLLSQGFAYELYNGAADVYVKTSSVETENSGNINVIEDFIQESS